MAGSAGITAADLIGEALSILGVKGDDTLSAGDLQSSFFTLCAIIDGYGAQPLTFRQTAVLSFTTTAGKGSYVIGPATTGVDWVTPFVPLEFSDGDITMLTGSLELPVRINTKRQWEAIGIKSLQSSIITDVWPDLGITAQTLNFWPVPSVAIPVNVYLSQQIAALASTSTSIVMPPCCQEMITFELVIKCSSKFGAPIPEWIPAAYLDAKANVKASNFPILDARCDAALLGANRRTGGGSIDFYLGR